MINDKKLQAYIPIQKTDETLLRYIRQVISPTIEGYNNQQIIVPVIYNGAERWVQVRRRNYLVDEKGNVLYPIISFSRTSIKLKDNKIVNKIWYSGNRNFIEIQNRYSKDRPFDTLDARNGNIEKTSYFNLMLPIPITCNYEFQIYTETHIDMNQILESFFLHQNKWWIIDGYRIKTQFSDFSHTIEIQTNEQRLIKCNFSITTESTLFPKSYQNLPPIEQKKPTKNITSDLNLDNNYIVINIQE